MFPDRLETATPQEILAWALDTYRTRAALTSSFGIESAALLHMATRIDADLPVIFLDTGHLFPETLAYAERLTSLLGLNLRVYRATHRQVMATQGRLEDAENRMGTCCDEVKVDLLSQALVGVDCWIAGLRRDQAPTRRAIPVAQRLDDGRVKVHPLAAWTADRVRTYMVENELPIHPLWFQGYTSVGCKPCTTRPIHAEDLRSGRWPGQEKTECGIHVAVKVGRAGR